MSKLFRYFGIHVPKGEYLFREGDEADTLYLIHKGSVKISKSVGNLEKRIQVLREGEFVGEMAVINSLPRSADAVALEDCDLIKMDRVSFDSTIEKNRQFALSFI
jgi:CRP-like cAMP-binding protein